MSTPPTRSSYAAGHFELVIDHHAATAFVKSVEGGWSRASVVDDPVGSGPLRVKHMSTVDIDPISFEFGLTGANEVLDWIEGSWKRRPSRRNGHIIHANFDLLETYRHDFLDALLTETTFPALDGSSKDSGYIKCKMQPERVFTSKLPGTGNQVGGTITPNMRQKLWTPAAFRFSIDKIDGMEHTSKIDSFTIKQSVKKHYTGADRFPTIEPVGIQFPNISGTISLEYADQLLKWHQDYVNTGMKDHPAQKEACIEFLSPDRKKTIFQIDLKEVGILYAGIEPSQANQEQIKRVKFELYLHSMEMSGQVGFE